MFLSLFPIKPAVTINPLLIITFIIEHWNIGTLEHWNIGTLEHFSQSVCEPFTASTNQTVRSLVVILGFMSK